MTREEAKAILIDKVKPCLNGTEWENAVDMAIKALEEPYEDAISKEEVLHRIKVSSDITMDGEDETDPWIKGYDAGIEDAIGMIETTPLVKSKVKGLHWMPNLRFGMYPTEEHFFCSKCGSQSMRCSKFCPECGAKMEER